MITKLRSSPSQVNFNFISEPSGLAPTKQLAFHPNVGEASLRACRNHRFGVVIDGFWQCSWRISWGWNQETWIFSALEILIPSQLRRALCVWNMGQLQRTTIDCGYQTTSIVWKSTRNSPNSPIHPERACSASVARIDGDSCPKQLWLSSHQSAQAGFPEDNLF